jgi:protein-disulfide isomerase
MGKAARNTAVRDRVRAQREADQKRERTRRIARIAVVAVLAVGAVVAGWWYAAQQNQSETTTALAPVTIQDDGSVVMAKPGVEKPVLDVYEDFQCPACEQMERVTGATIKNLAAEGHAKVVFHPITIFGKEPTKSNSVRAAAAARCVPEDKWVAYHDKLFEEQPSESEQGFAIPDLVAWGKEVGITDPAFERCVTSQQHAQAHQAASQRVLNSGVISQGTPTLVLNGTEVDNTAAFSPSGLRQAVLDAAK